MYNMMYRWANYCDYGNNCVNQFGWNMPFHMGWGLGILFGGAIAIITIWSLVWKGLALWKAAHRDSKPWFVALLIINTAGILEILYIYYFSRKPDNWLHRIARKIRS